MLPSIFSVLLGLAFGSFLNVCISRLPKHQSVVHPRSRCPQCLRPIRMSDNIPLLSWMLLRGRCRNCHESIPWRYPLVEAATASLFLLCYLHFRATLHGFGSAVLCWLLLGLAATDAEELLLPDALTLPGIAAGIVFSGFGYISNPGRFSFRAALHAALWAAIAAGLILLIRGSYWLVRRREGIGLGDAKLLALIAAWLGPLSTLLVFFLGALLAAAYGAGLVILNRFQLRANGRDPIQLPFGAFLCLAGIFAIFAGLDAIYWYMSFFH